MTSDSEQPNDGEAPREAIDAGNYEVIRRRLVTAGRDLQARAEALNAARAETFGTTELSVIAQLRVRTEHNCVPQDVVSVSGKLVFGYNVYVGLKSEVAVSDVFSLHRLDDTPEGPTFHDVDLETAAGGFLGDPAFVRDFSDTYKYYRETRLKQLRIADGKVFAIFQYGASERDLRVFRWNILPDGRPSYVDNRGERDLVLPESHSFRWKATTRDDQVAGRFPHVSIENELFVECVGGDLTVKLENNTQHGRGIYTEPVDNATQTLDDARIEYARAGGLLLLRIRPYGEDVWRHLVYSPRTRQVRRIDAIGQGCLELPDEDGVIFPGGYHLTSGDHKVFDERFEGQRPYACVRSPNGEDVLYVFHEPSSGRYLLLPYNLIRKEVRNQIACHGYSIFPDGRMVVFRADNPEPARVHAMQVWSTPFASVDFAAAAPASDSFHARIGNAELVRGISETLAITRMIDEASPTRRLYEDLIAATRRTIDGFYWIAAPEAGGLADALKAVGTNAELIVDEFDKVVALTERASSSLQEVEVTHEEQVRKRVPGAIDSAAAFMHALAELRRHRGHLISMREIRYIDRGRLDALEDETVACFDAVSTACVAFMGRPEAMEPLLSALAQHEATLEGVQRTADARALRTEIDAVGEGLEVLSEVMANIEVDDPTERTRILERVSEVFALVNRARAAVEARRVAIARREGTAEFAVQFALLGQAVTSALGVADTPEKCDEQLSRLLLQLEELEGRFSELDEHLEELATRRDEIQDAFDARKQSLVDARQRRAESLAAAAERMLGGVRRRAATYTDRDGLNAYFASDPMVQRLRRTVEQLVELGDSVKADELESRLTRERQDAQRGLRDRQDLYEDGAAVVRLGRHRFNVNTQPIELTVVPRGDGMAFHLAGTDYYAAVDTPEFLQTRPFWSQQLVSEDDTVYRGEYLAASILIEAERGRGELTVEQLHALSLEDAALAAHVRDVAASRYDEGYERGVHDSDAALILARVLQLRQHAGVLRFTPDARAWACAFWALGCAVEEREAWHARAHGLRRVRESFPGSPAVAALGEALGQAVAEWAEKALNAKGLPSGECGAYLFEELTVDHPRFVLSGDAQRLRDSLLRHLDGRGARREFEGDMRVLHGRLPELFALARAWMEAMVASDAELAALRHAQLEASVALVCEGLIERDTDSTNLVARVEGLLGHHARIVDRAMELRLDTFIARTVRFIDERVPAYAAYRALRADLVERERDRLRIGEFTPQVMSAFVRNRLIDEVYLPIIGDNLAKQMGAAGAAKRTDLMGLLLLVSPPGYGKTTLMEYVASRLGLVFMKINGPALGHGVRSLDPAEAPNATARLEVQKINLAFEMGNNVMLYLDDIQHTHSELLQKFISLCDATRRIEGVWNGRTRTYDLRGKKFAVVMAGNPYTEAGERFQIPDMLANRADTTNLGEILSGREEQFALSYVENALTSNSTLAPLAARGMADVYRVVDMAAGKPVATTDLEHDYSAIELTEMQAVLRHLFRARDVLLRVNAQYIASAAQSDDYRTEPRFQLQGSYRNMNKIAEKISPAMNDSELDALITDHYQGESQTLTSGAEHNLLKLGELRGRLSADDAARWGAIKAEFGRRKKLGGEDEDPVTRVTGVLTHVAAGLESVRDTIADAAVQAASVRPVPEQSALVPSWSEPLLDRLDAIASGLSRPAPTDSPWAKPMLDRLDTIAANLARPAPDPGRSIAPVLRQIDQRLAVAHERAAQRSASTASVPATPQPPASPRLEVGDAVEQFTRALAASTNTQSAQLAAVLARLDSTLGVSIAGLQKALASTPARSSADGVADGPPSVGAGAPGPARGHADPATAATLERLDATLRLLGQQQQTLRGMLLERQSAPAAAAPALAGVAPTPVEAAWAPGSSDTRGAVEAIIGQQAAMVERTMVPLIQSATRHLDEGRVVNSRLVELLDVLKLFAQHLHRLSEDDRSRRR